MRILLASPEMQHIPNHLDLGFIEFLKRRFHVKGLLQNHDADSNFSSLLESYTIPQINLAEWDLILVQEASSLAWISELTHDFEFPVIFISHAYTWQYRPFICKNLYSVINLTIEMQIIDIPPELVIHVKKPPFLTRTSRHVMIASQETIPSKIKAMHWHQSFDQDLGVVRSIIASVNALPEFDLTIVCSRAVRDALYPCTNPNISFQIQPENDKVEARDVHVMITSGRQAIESCYCGCPVLIVGKRGLAGMITPENISDHLRTHFDGRIGGEINEIIPMLFLVDQLKDFQENFYEFKEAARQVAAIMETQLDEERFFFVLDQCFSNNISINKKILASDYQQLYPVMTAGVRTFSNAQEIFIAKGNNKIVGSISVEEHHILEKCDGSHSIHDLADGLNLENVASFILELWFEKVIVFRHKR